MRIPSSIARAALGAGAGLMTPDVLPIAFQRAGLELVTVGRPGPAVERTSEGGVTGERHRAATHRALLYLHGGGYCIGSPRTHRRVAARLARSLGAEGFVPAYRLAPESPFPAALDDVTAVYTSMVGRFDEVLIAGDSAGGGLALALAIRARDRELPPPVAVGLISPWLDLVGPHEETGDPLITPSRLKRWKSAYAPVDPGNPEASPLFAELDGLSPIVLHSAGDDPLLADAERLEHRVKLEHRRHPGQFHAFHALAGVTAEADEAIDALAFSLRAHCTPAA